MTVGTLHAPACLRAPGQPAARGSSRPLGLPARAGAAPRRPSASRRCAAARPVAAAADLADLGIADEDEGEARQRRGRRGRGGGDGEDRREGGREERKKEFEERVVQVSRVTKVVKGGKQMSFRAVVVVGDEKGKVGVGCASAKEVIDAVAKAVLDAKKHFIAVPLTRSFSFPHRIDGIAGAAKVMLRPASEGTGVIAGGAVRVVLELAGIKNAFGKQLGSGNPLNNARATVDGLARQRTLQMVADERGLTMEELIGRQEPDRTVENPAAEPAAVAA